MLKNIYWVKFSALIYSRNHLFWIAQLIIFLFLTVYLNQYIIGDDDNYSPPNALKLSSQIVQSGILIFLIIGSNLVSNKEGVNDIYNSLGLERGILISYSIIMLFLTTFFTFFYFIYYIGFLVFSNNVYIDFLIYSIKYMSIYWWFPFFTSGIFGICIGFYFKNSFKYVLIIIIWLTIGPLNDMYFTEKFSMVLSWGEKEPSIPFHYLYGFSLNSSIFFERLTWFFISILLLLITGILKRIVDLNFKSIFTIIILGIFILYSVCLGFNTESELLLEKGEFSIAKEMDKYKLHSEFNTESYEQKYIISNYDIELNLTDTLAANIIFKILNNSQEDISEITFSLYHGFKISEISHLNKNLKYSRKGDQVTVDLGTSISKNQFFTLNISYSGKSSPLYFVSDDTAYLPSSFAWLPKTVIQPTFSIFEESIHRHNFNDFNLAEYKLTLKKGEKIYTNLKKTNEETWEGDSSGGLTIVKGDFINKKYKEKTITYPKQWARSENDIRNYIDSLEYYTNEVNKIFNDIEIKIPNSLIILPNTFINDFHFEEDFWFTEDHSILGVQRVFSVNSELLEQKSSILINSLVPAITWKNKANHEELDMAFTFNAVVSKYIAKNEESVPADYMEFVKTKLSSSKPERQELLNNIEFLMRSTSEKKKEEFLNEWYQLIISDDYNNFDLLDDLIKEYREEVDYDKSQ